MAQQESNKNSLNEIKSMAKEIMNDRIEKLLSFLREMSLPPPPPPTVPSPSQSRSQCSLDDDGMSTKLFSEMSKEELHEETRKIVISMFSSLRSLVGASVGKGTKKN